MDSKHRPDADYTPEDLGNQVSYMVRLIQILAYKNFEKTVTGFGSAPRYFGLLRLVEANPGITQSRLAETIALDRSSVVPILDTLETEGWLERKPSAQDKRLRCIYMTETGCARLSQLKADVEAHEAAMVAGLTSDERDALVKTLSVVANNLRDGYAPKPVASDT